MILERLTPLSKIMRSPWEMSYIGFIYSSLAILLIKLIFSKDFVLNQYRGLLITLLTLIFCMPFMYRIIRQEEGKDLEINEEGKLIKEHAQALKALMWLFLGLTLGFSFWYLILPQEAPENFDAQIKTFCTINSPNNYENCLKQYGVSTGSVTITAYASSIEHLMGILFNNLSVMIFTLIFSLFFGAGAIFILIWNSTVIATAIGMFSQDLSKIYSGLIRYLIHGLPEISAYFVAALAGGIVSVAFVRRDLRGERLWIILQDALILVIVAVLILIVSAFMEVYLTPSLI